MIIQAKLKCWENLNSFYRCWLSGNHAIYVGRVLDNILHAHYAIQVCYGIEEEVRIEDDQARSIRGRLLVIPSNFPHRLLPEGARVMYLYLDPLEVPRLRKLLAFDDFDEQVLWDCLADRGPAPLLSALAERMSGARLIAGVERDPARDRPASVSRLDPRVRRIAESLRREPDHDLATLAREVRLSSSRTRHLFKSEMGLGTSRFRLWSRMLVAIHAAAEGASLIDAANHAGFADQAHFNRTMKTAFGITPAQLLASPRVELKLL